MTPTPPATLVVLFKRPALNQGKQRLAAGLGAELAFRIAEDLLACTLADARRWPGPVVLAPAHARDSGWADALLQGAEIVPQCEGNLGTRLNALDQTLRGCGHARTLYIGSDAPLLTQDILQRADLALERSDTVIRPAEDGGVTLMGNRTAWPDLEPLPWSSDGLATALAKTCENHGLSCHELGLGMDVDRPEDLMRLHEQLRHDPRRERRRLQQTLQDTLLQETMT